MVCVRDFFIIKNNKFFMLRLNYFLKLNYIGAFGKGKYWAGWLKSWQIQLQNGVMVRNLKGSKL